MSKIALIGLGNIGGPMSLNLLRQDTTSPPTISHRKGGACGQTGLLRLWESMDELCTNLCATTEKLILPRLCR